jgi:hypothetical protein
MIIIKSIKAALFISLVVFLTSCGEENEKPVAPKFIFKHNVNGFDLQKSAMNYTNKAGNQYQVDELQYFISVFYLGDKY